MHTIIYLICKNIIYKTHLKHDFLKRKEKLTENVRVAFSLTKRKKFQQIHTTRSKKKRYSVAFFRFCSA